ncbi:MAG TPA: phage tail assembly chaperone [Rhizomicrobium sp.]
MGLSPDTFWSMTLAEWNACVAGWQARHRPRVAAPLARSELDELMKAHPDG